MTGVLEQLITPVVDLHLSTTVGLRGCFRFVLALIGVGEPLRDLILALVHCVDHRLVQEMPQCHHEDDEVDQLGDHGERVEQHGVAAPQPVTWAQNGLAKIRISEMTNA